MLILNSKQDKAQEFGTWEDPVSKFLYDSSTKDILKKIGIPNNVGDYGGGNGLLKQHIPHSTSIDIDKTKNPDIVENILKHSKHYDLVVLRYVLHCLTDSEVLELFDVLNCTHVLVIQFVNEDLKSKYFNSVNECKYFRTNRQLKALLPNKIQTIYSKNYKVDGEFYENRLEKDWNYKAHSETLKAYYL